MEIRDDSLEGSLDRIATAFENQNKLVEKSIEVSQRILAVQILTAKISAKLAVVVNAMSVVDHKEFTELVNQI